MSSILNNISALGASRQLGISGAGLQQTIQRLTTGKRINSASDDAAGLGISNKLQADIKISAQGQRNANDGVSYLQTADGVLDEVTNLLTRASELAQQAKTGTISDSNRTNIDTEFQNIMKTVIDIGQNTKFNGASVFTSGAIGIAVGGFSAINLTVGTISTATSALGLSTTGTSGTAHAYAASAVAIAGQAQAGATTCCAPMVAAAAALLAANPADAHAQAFSADVTLMAAAYQSGDTTNGGVNAFQAWIDSNQFKAAHPTDLNGLAAYAMANYQDAHGVDVTDPANVAANNAGLAAAAQGPNTLVTTPGDSLTTAGNATSAASKIADAIASLSTTRASLGASMQQMNAVSNSLGIQVQNFTAANSQIQDANIADEVVNLTKFQILNQSGTSALGKANQASQGVLALLQ